MGSCLPTTLICQVGGAAVCVSGVEVGGLRDSAVAGCWGCDWS